MKTSIVLTITTFALMEISFYGLRWTQHDFWFFSIVIFFILFVLAVSDFLKKYFSLKDHSVPVVVHVLAAVFFLLVGTASIYGFNNPEYSKLELTVAPFFVALCVYVVFIIVKIRFWLS